VLRTALGVLRTALAVLRTALDVPVACSTVCVI
jgi:hypothetical protein